MTIENVRFIQPNSAEMMTGCAVEHCDENARWKIGEHYVCGAHTDDVCRGCGKLVDPDTCECGPLTRGVSRRLDAGLHRHHL